jgi:hypothetical protein
VRIGPSNNKRLALIGLGVVLILAAILPALSPQYVLSIKDVTNGRTVLERRANPGDNLWICFINSVEKLPVADHFVVDEHHRWVFTETVYQAPYAGYVRPERGGNVTLIAPGTTRISGYHRRMEAVTFYAGYTSKHMLFLNGQWLPLYDVALGGDLIRATIEKQSLWTSILKRIRSRER